MTFCFHKSLFLTESLYIYKSIKIILIQTEASWHFIFQQLCNYAIVFDELSTVRIRIHSAEKDFVVLKLEIKDK